MTNAAGPAAPPTMRIDSSNVTSSYTNTCYASSTREEVGERGQKDKR